MRPGGLNEVNSDSIDWTIAQEKEGHAIQSMQWERRIVMFSAADTNNPALEEQRQQLSSWSGATERDVSMVQIAGDQVNGSIEAASDLRRRYHLPTDHFAIILIGKDGHVALRSTTPLTADVLTKTIDAMPMRRAGQR